MSIPVDREGAKPKPAKVGTSNSKVGRRHPFGFTTFEMADNEEEEPNPQPHHVRNYYGENDTFDGVRLNAKRRKETSSSWPNQKCLSDIIMQRIVYSLHKQNSDLSNFVQFDFQVIKTNCSVGLCLVMTYDSLLRLDLDCQPTCPGIPNFTSHEGGRRCITLSYIRIDEYSF